MERHWLAYRRSIGCDPTEPLPPSPEMERIQEHAEGDDALVHRETTALHLLHATLRGEGSRSTTEPSLDEPSTTTAGARCALPSRRGAS